MTQTNRILQYMRNFGSITPLEALKEFGVLRLGAIIYNLRRAGFDIETDMVNDIGRYGNKITYARYILKGEQ